jgi:hypothetical protein
MKLVFRAHEFTPVFNRVHVHCCSQEVVENVTRIKELILLRRYLLTFEQPRGITPKLLVVCWIIYVIGWMLLCSNPVGMTIVVNSHIIKSLFFWPLYCLSCFDVRLLITPLVYNVIYNVYTMYSRSFRLREVLFLSPNLS